MSSSASSHETRSKSPAAFLFSGWRTRSGSFWTSVIAMPLGQAYPFESGWSSSGRSWVTLPSSTVATIPQSDSQIRQYVTFCSGTADDHNAVWPGGQPRRTD